MWHAIDMSYGRSACIESNAAAAAAIQRVSRQLVQDTLLSRNAKNN